MTEQEAIDRLKGMYMDDAPYMHGRRKEIEVAIKALEEVQAYKAIGTPEEIKEIRNKAVEEFVSRLEKHEQENWIDHQEYGITWSDIEKIAEEMKGGAEQ